MACDTTYEEKIRRTSSFFPSDSNAIHLTIDPNASTQQPQTDDTQNWKEASKKKKKSTACDTISSSDDFHLH